MNQIAGCELFCPFAVHFIGSQVLCKMNSFGSEDSVKGYLARKTHCRNNHSQNLDWPTFCFNMYYISDCGLENLTDGANLVGRTVDSVLD